MEMQNQIESSQIVDRRELLEYLYEDENFVKLFPMHFGNKTPEFHNEINQFLDTNPTYAVVIAPRGRAKSTGVTFKKVLKKVAYREERCIAIVSETASMAIKFLERLRYEFENNARFMEIYGLQLVRATQTELEIKVGDNEIITIICKGGAQQVRGLINKQGARPTLIILDDFEGEESRTSEATREAKKEVFFRSIMPAVDDFSSKIWVLGTVPHEDSLIWNLYNDDSGMWQKKFYAALDKFGKSIWEDKFPTNEVILQREQWAKQGKIDAWYCEFMNDPTPKTEQRFREEDLVFYDRKKVLQELHKYRVYSLADNQSSSTVKSDWDVVCTVAVRRERLVDGGVIDKWYILDMDYGKRELPEKIQSFFEAKRKYNVYALGIENTNFQRVYVQETKRAMETKPYAEKFIVEGVGTGGVPKTDRIMGILQYFKSGVVHVPNDLPTWYVEHFLPEMRNFNPHKDNSHDDGLDALAMLPYMLDEYGYNSYSYEMSRELEDIDLSKMKNPLVF